MNSKNNNSKVICNSFSLLKGKADIFSQKKSVRTKKKGMESDQLIENKILLYVAQ